MERLLKFQVLTWLKIACVILVLVYISLYIHSVVNPKPVKPVKKFSYLLTKRRWVKSVECERIFNNESNEIKYAELLQDRYLSYISSDMYINLTKNCSKFVHDRLYILDSLSPEELNFPIAYSIMVYKDVCQIERLLRSIYRPQNFYCIHIDRKMSKVDKNALEAITSCFHNVFLSSTSYYVIWSKITSLQADVACMKDLLKRKWKYFINLTGQEFPLKTNLEIVKILKAYNGANDLKITSRNVSYRWKMAGPPLDGLNIFKGRVHIVVSRPFVEFAVQNETAIRLLQWLNGTELPDETFYTTINFNPQLGIPGSFDGILDKRCISGFGSSLNRYKRWSFLQHRDYKCHGKIVRGICIPGTGDLPVLDKRPELFLNKLYWNYHHYVLDCLEEMIYNRTVDGLYGKLKLDMSIYKNMYFVKHSIKKQSQEKPCKCAKE